MCGTSRKRNAPLSSLRGPVRSSDYGCAVIKQQNCHEREAAPSAVTCEYGPDCGGFPLAVLEDPQPAEFFCGACQHIARDAVTACQGPRASSPRRAHSCPLSKAAIFLALLCHPLFLLQGVTCGAPAARPPRCPSNSSARAAAARASTSPLPARPHVVPLRRWLPTALRGACGRGRWGHWTRTWRSAYRRPSRAPSTRHAAATRSHASRPQVGDLQCSAATRHD